jgi:hypothetical protein
MAPWKQQFQASFFTDIPLQLNQPHSSTRDIQMSHRDSSMKNWVSPAFSTRLSVPLREKRSEFAFKPLDFDF